MTYVLDGANRSIIVPFSSVEERRGIYGPNANKINTRDTRGWRVLADVQLWITVRMRYRNTAIECKISISRSEVTDEVHRENRNNTKLKTHQILENSSGYAEFLLDNEGVLRRRDRLGPLNITPKRCSCSTQTSDPKKSITFPQFWKLRSGGSAFFFFCLSVF